MPALKAFGVNLKISGDDLVYPYAFSILLKLLWFCSIGYVLTDYDKEYHCNDGKMLKVYLLVLVGVQAIMIAVETTAMVISARGTIANSYPRRYLKWVLYIQSVWFLVQLFWDVVGVQWVFDPVIDCSSSHNVLILARVICTWNLITSLSLILFFVIRFGLLATFCKRPPQKLKYEEIAPSTSFSGRRLSTLSDESLSQHTRQRSWQWKIQSMFFFLNLQDKQKSVFAAVSATLADAFTKFRGYVPTDVLAGMALVRMEQSAERKQRSEFWDQSAPETRKPVKFYQEGVSEHYRSATRYMLFTMGAYGWPFFVYSKRVVGIIHLVSASIKSLFPKEVKETKLVRTVLGDNHLKWNLHSVLKLTGIDETDVIYANFKSEVFCPSFFVALDHTARNVVVVVRGTLSIVDALTDLSAQPAIMMTKEGVKLYAHEGMLNTANALHLKLEGEGILQRIFHTHPSYNLVIAGHSLGAGVASLLAMLLHSVYPTLHCFAFSPPGGLINLPAVHHTRSFITSVVLGNDLVPRLSLQNFEKLSERILYQLKHSKLPKYRIFMRSFFHWCGLHRPYSRSHAELVEDMMCEATMKKKQQEEGERGGSRLQRMPVLLSDEELFAVDKEEKELKQYGKKPFIVTDPLTGKVVMPSRQRPPLYLPGRILHLTRGPLLSTFFGLHWYRPIMIEWASQSEFDEIMLDEDVVSDHMPNTLYREMRQLGKQERLFYESEA